MNDGQACCSCLKVEYDPEDVETYVEEFSRYMPALRERWTCRAGCGSHFIREAAADHQVGKLRDEIEHQQKHIESLQAKVHLCAGYDKLEVENERLRYALQTILDWPDEEYEDTIRGILRTAEHALQTKGSSNADDS